MPTVPFRSARSAPLSPDLIKKLPSNLDAERSILGAVLLDNAAIVTAVKAGLHRGHFFLEQHAKVWTQMTVLAGDRRPIDLVTLTEELHNKGELDAAGGGAYVSALADGMPRVSNIEHYCNIVIEKAALRQLIHTTHAIQQEAFSEDTPPENILATAAQKLTEIQKPKNDNPAVVIGFRDLLVMELPPLVYALEPLLTIGGTGEMYGWRGTGKSLIATEIAFAMATGAPTVFPHGGRGGANWPVTQQYRVLYVYGEMHGAMIRDRARQIANGHGVELPTNEFFGTMCKDFQKTWRPNIATPRNRQIVEEKIFGGGYQVVIFDNLSTLWPASQEAEGDKTAILSEWFMDLNQRGITIIWLHHAGKSGEQRGGSEKEDMLDFVLKVRRPQKYQNDPELHVNVTIEKTRGEVKQNRWLFPFELSLHTENDSAQWLIRPSRDGELEAAFAMFEDGMKPGDVYPEVGISRATAFRYRKLWESVKDPKHWIED